MSFVKTYDIVDMVVAEASERFGSHWQVSEDKLNILKTDCTIVDRLVSDFDCESVEADIDEETMKIKVSITCPDMILEYGRTHPFFTLIKNTESFSFYAEGDSLRVDFVFAGLWEHRD